MSVQDPDKPREEAWAALDRKFRSALTVYFFRRLNDRAEAEDCTQEVFVRLTRRPDRHNGEAIDAYVFKIAASVLGDWGRYRTSRRLSAHTTLTGIAEAFGTPPALVEDRTPERVLMGKVTLREVEDALKELSPRAREIFLLARVENMSHKEIASVYGISVSAVEKHVQKAFAHFAAKVYRP